MTPNQTDAEFDQRPNNDNRKFRPKETQASMQSQQSQPLTFGQRWNETRLTKTATFWYWLASIGAILLLGFNWGGWMTSARANDMATKLADTAVIQRLAPICVAQVQLDPANAQKLVELKALGSYQQGDYVSKQGWATMSGEEKPDSKVASACARLLVTE